MDSLAREVATLADTLRFVIIHGGGPEVTRWSETLGYSPNFKDGIRMTTAEEMEVVDMVLSGKVNKAMVRRFVAAGIAAVGLSGSDGPLFTAVALNEQTRTGRIDRVDTSLLSLLLERSFLPIVASTSTSKDGVALNINADEAALAIAARLPAERLLFLSDTPGILSAKGELIPQLDELSAERHIEQGTITGGMIPKVRASLNALRAGVGAIVVGRYQSAGELRKLLDGGTGTQVVLAAERRDRLGSR